MNKRQRLKYNFQIKAHCKAYYQGRRLLIDAALIGDDISVGVYRGGVKPKLVWIGVNNRTIWQTDDLYMTIHNVEAHEAMAMLRDHYLDRVPLAWIEQIEENGDNGHFVQPKPGPLFDRRDRLSHNDRNSQRIKSKARR